MNCKHQKYVREGCKWKSVVFCQLVGGLLWKSVFSESMQNHSRAPRTRFTFGLESAVVLWDGFSATVQWVFYIHWLKLRPIQLLEYPIPPTPLSQKNPDGNILSKRPCLSCQNDQKDDLKKSKISKMSKMYWICLNFKFLGWLGLSKRIPYVWYIFGKPWVLLLKSTSKIIQGVKYKKCQKFNMSQLFALSNATLRGSHLYLCLCSAVENWSVPSCHPHQTVNLCLYR